MKNILRLSFLLLIVASFAGCGGDETQAGETQELSGGPLKKESQLRGTWMRTTEGAFAGLEFTEGGQVLASLSAVGRQYGTVTFQYSVLDGGRLGLTGAGNRTVTFATTVDGDRMEIRPEGGGMSLGFQPVAQQFRKLEKGQTLAAAMQEEEEKRMASLQARYESLQDFLAAEDLVMVRAEDNGPEAVFALRFDHWQPQIGGHVIMDEKPAKDDVLAPVSQHPISGQIVPLDNVTDKLKISIAIAGATAPRNDPESTGRAEFVVEGPIKEVKSVEGKLIFPKAWMGEADYRLERNGKQKNAVVSHMEAQAEARKQELLATAKKMGGRITLSGSKTLSNQGGVEEAIFAILERQEGEAPLYGGMAKVGNSPEQPIVGGVDLLMGEGVLYVNLQRGEQWRLEFKDDGKSLEGLWRPNNRSDFISHGDVALAVENFISMEKLAAEREAIREFLANGLRTPQHFTGFAMDRHGGDNFSLWPVSVELVKQPDGSANAKMWILPEGVGVSLDGRDAGGSFAFKGQETLEGSAPIGVGVFGRHTLDIKLAGIDPEPTFEGRLVTGMKSADGLVLRPVNGAKPAERRARIMQAVNGRQFLLRQSDTSRPREEQTWLVLQAKEDGSVTGEIYGEGDGLFRPECPPGLLTGKMIEDRGHLLMQLALDSSPHPTYGGGRDSKRTNLIIAVDDSGESPVFQGWTVPERGNKDWFALVPVESKHTPSADNLVRLAAQRMGAALKPPAQVKPGDEVLLLVHATDRDARLGRVHCNGTHYNHGDSIPAAALHAGLVQPGESGIVKLVFAEPFLQPVEAIERNGLTSRQANFRENNTTPSFTIERVEYQ